MVKKKTNKTMWVYDYDTKKGEPNMVVKRQAQQLGKDKLRVRGVIGMNHKSWKFLSEAKLRV